MNQPLRILLRAAAAVGLLVLTATGCHWIATFDTSGLASAEPQYHCQAEVIDALDLRTMVYSYDDSTHGGAVRSQCFVQWADLDIDSLEGVEDAWHRWLDEEIAGEGWCIVADTISCTEAGALGHDSCPAITRPAEPREFCPQDALPCCIRSAPSELDFEVLQDAAGMDNWTAVGFASTLEPSGTLQNYCDREVSFRPQDGLVGAAAGDFELLANTCTVPEPPADHPDGLTLSPMGTPGDYCTYQVRFTPSAHGVRWARLDFVQSDTAACTNDDMAHLRGRARAGVLAGMPAELCLGPLPDGRCTQSAFELTNNGPGRVTVEALDVTGSFELLSPAPHELAPGASTTITVGWCAGFAGDVDDDGTLTLVSNATAEQILVPLARRTAGCP